MTNTKPGLDEMEKLIYKKTADLADLLVSKNKKYGNSAMVPIGIFHKGDAVEGLNVRIDDKLKRIAMGNLQDAEEDTLMDLAGYLVLLMIARDGGKI